METITNLREGSWKFFFGFWGHAILCAFTFGITLPFFVDFIGRHFTETKTKTKIEIE